MTQWRTQTLTTAKPLLMSIFNITAWSVENLRSYCETYKIQLIGLFWWLLWCLLVVFLALIAVHSTSVYICNGSASLIFFLGSEVIIWRTAEKSFIVQERTSFARTLLTKHKWSHPSNCRRNVMLKSTSNIFHTNTTQDSILILWVS